MYTSDHNFDPDEQHKFDAHATHWWDQDGPLRTLHHINPARMDYISGKISLKGAQIADIGCGAGVLSESLAKEQAHVTGIDISQEAITIARAHALGQQLSIQYYALEPEQFAAEHRQEFDAVTCMEMLEHVPDPFAIVKACSNLLKPGGQAVFSTINRTPRAYINAVLGAEYLFKVLPTGTHDYSRFIRPSELVDWCRRAGLQVRDISGMAYSPFTASAWLHKNPSVNYLLYATRDGTDPA